MPGLHTRPISTELILHAEQAVEADSHLITFVLPGIPESVRIARLRIRAALGFHRLDEYADDAEIITSELVGNAVQHACGDGTETVGVILMLMPNPESVTVVVTDSSPEGPVKREPSDHSDQGRGLLIVDELSVRWGWNPGDSGKAVYAILAKGCERVMRRQRGAPGELLAEQCAIVGANIRALRRRRGWTQAKLGELMGWPSASTVCAAEGHRGDRQRGFTDEEVKQLAAILGVSPGRLTTRCANCGGRPPAGFACLTCGAEAITGGDLSNSVPAGHPEARA